MSLTGRGCSKIALTTVKMVVFAPIPKAKDKIATALKPGLLLSTRAPCRRSCQKYSILHPTEGPTLRRQVLYALVRPRATRIAQTKNQHGVAKAWELQAIRRLVLRFHCVPWRGVAQEFQATLVSCFLRDSHSEPVRTRGATSIKRGISLKTLEAVQGWPSRVRYSRALRASAMLRKEMS